jgi:ring-1,2-phenylacetyl-CoA epoxidase subunit PaaE
MSNDGLYKILQVISVHEEVKGFKTFTFHTEHPIPYKSGQYLTFVKTVDGDEMRRSYSITSSPDLDEPLSVGVKRIPNGFFSRFFIDKVKAGDKILTTGAGGFFVLPDDIKHYRQVFFFAAGSGITPVFSLIKTALYKHPHLFVVLIYSNASAGKTVFLNELIQLQSQFLNFHLELLFSDSADLSKARLYRELLLELVKRHSSAPQHNTLFYICGPESYMRMCTYVLQQEGFPPAHIKKENFIVSAKKLKAIDPPDHQTRNALIRYGRNNYRISVRYPDSILQAAKKSGIVLPYSCEAGQCGNCAARCTSGKIWHSYNEVLTEKELQGGVVLTCVGHPVGGDVVIEIG